MPDIDQLALAPQARHNNQHLFSDHYLNENLPARPQWQALADQARPVMEHIADLLSGFNRASNEKQTERNLVVPVLELLGHTFEVQPSLNTPDGTKTPDYAFYREAEACDANKGQVLTDDLPRQGGIAVGDAKRWKMSLDTTPAKKSPDAFSNKNPSFQIYFYMQHSGVTWGILTNGRQWRLYHRDTAHKLDHFYEVDLEELTQAGDVERFLYFYAFLRREAFDDGPLSVAAILKESADYAHSVGESLKEQVYIALRHIAQGFLDHSPNNLHPDPETLKTIYDDSLILLYRLLFILYAESRELLPISESQEYLDTYSLHAIKQNIANDLGMGKRLLKGSALIHGRLNYLFEAINLGNPSLKVINFNGGLFDPENHPFLTTHAVGDFHMQHAIDKLARINREFVDYRDLSVRHLGTIYEGLLEYRLRTLPKPVLSNAEGPVRSTDEEPEDDWLVTLITDRGERKATGSYYTPDVIVKHIVSRTLDPLLKHAVEDKQTDSDKLRAVLAINVLDPAMGSGHFLVEATEHIARFLVDLAVVPEDNPHNEADIGFWKRSVVQSCIYGVDLNPLAVELAKLSLWLTTIAKDRPLSFLDHHLRPGNSLVGADLEHLRLKAIRGKQAKTENGEANGQIALLADSAFAGKVSGAVGLMTRIERNEALSVEDVKEQERLYEGLRRDLTDKYARLLDLVTAAQFGLTIDALLRDSLIHHLTRNNSASTPAYDKALGQADEIARREGFFHWEIEFPEIYFDNSGQPLGDNGGFDAVVGNPPWERIKLQENEFFAARDPEIARAPRAADRKALIKTLQKRKPALWREYEAAKDAAERFLTYVRDSGFYPLMGKGDTNLYTLFSEKALRLMNKTGRVGLVVPSGIATDDTTKEYFQHIVSRRMLSELLDFENKEGLFPEVHREQKFSIVLLTGEGTPQESIRCGFFLHNAREIEDEERISLLKPEDFRLFNPNTLTCPIFRRRRDADLTRKIYGNVPVLINRERGEAGNPWGVRFSTMFHMTNDSALFRTARELVAEGFWLGTGNIYTKGEVRYLPLYEGKMVSHFDHRYANGTASDELAKSVQASELVTTEAKSAPSFSAMPRSWVPELSCEKTYGAVPQKWLIGLRNIANPNNIRTFIVSAVPRVAVGNSLQLIILSGTTYTLGYALLANFSSFLVDYVARQKVGSRNLNFFIVEQFPILPPETYKRDWHGVRLAEFIKERVLELCYTAHDLKGFAEDMGYDGPPFAWDEERRLHLRCQLDALYFHLYQLTRDEAAEIMDTFPIVKRQDEARYGAFRTKELILAYYSAYAAGNMDAWVNG